MENHPIPQDVTGFQFRLVGNMTIKQFAYVAAGVVAAVIVYYSPLFFLGKLILIPLFAGSGAALSFLPVEGRPLDLMVGNFFHDLLSPTQYIYAKTGGLLPLSTVDLRPQAQQSASEQKHQQKQQKQHDQREKQLSTFLHGLPHQPKSSLDERESLFLGSVFSPAGPQIYVTPESNQTPRFIPTPQVAADTPPPPSQEAEDELEREAEAIKRELEAARAQEEKLEEEHQPVETVHDSVEQLQNNLKDILAQKQQLEHELEQLKKRMQEPAASDTTRAPSQPPVPTKQSQNVRIVPANIAASVGLPAVPDAPNIILGIIRDPRGNVLPNILIEIKDQKGDPVRAFKTNGLGQFASATSLPNGTYTMEIEDPKDKARFDTVALEATGAIMPPLEIISHDAREDLRKELFS